MCLRTFLPSLLFLSVLPVQAVHLRVSGTVVDMCSGKPLAAVHVEVFKDGTLQHTLRSDKSGRYSLRLDNNAGYVIQLGHPGRVSKCYALDTHGGTWDDDTRTVDLEVEVVLFQKVEGIDLELFDMPMGMARFNPLSGHVAWNATYDRRVRPEAEKLMEEVARLLEAMEGPYADACRAR